MRRLAIAAFFAAVLSTPAFACGHSGLHVGVGPLYLGIGHFHPCPAAVAVVPVPPLPAPPALPVAVIPVPVEVVEVEPPLPPPPMVVAPVVIAAPVVAAPVVVAAPPPAPAPVVAAAPVVVAPPPDEPQRLAVKWMPGFSAPLSIGDRIGVGQPSFGQSFGIEYRLSHFFALRGDMELRSGARTFDVPGLKFSLLPHSRLRPFASASLAIGQNAADPNNGVSIGFVGAAGLDIILFKYVFLTAEARYRSFPADCCSLPRISGLVGIGASFF